MVIENATIVDSNEIAMLLSEYFKRANQKLKRDYYLMDDSVMKKNVMNRLMEPNSEFRYFVAKKDADAIGILGFVNVMLVKKRGEVLITLVKDEVDDREGVLKDLFSHGIDYLREKGIEKIRLELSDAEKVLHRAVMEVGGVELSKNYIL